MSDHVSAAHDAHTLVIGAGAAGLSAASELAAQGHRVTIVEARERLGGRILTDRTRPAAVPIELGAEFVHGESPRLLEWLRLANDVPIDAARERWVARAGELRRADQQHRQLRRVLGSLAAPARDVSFAEFLERRRDSVPAGVRRLACSMVEGFDAADPARISAREVLEEWSGPASVSAPTFRPARGYDGVIQAMHRSMPAGRVELHHDTNVRAVDWRRGRVIVEAQRHGADVRFVAERAIVTLPLGVLQLPGSAPNAVRFTPELRSKRRALLQLASGPVIKVVMAFSGPFWTQINGGRYRSAAFFFAPGAPFPTLWTTLPVRSSVLVAWCAGPRAARLSGQGEGALESSVMASLRTVFGRRDYAGMLEYLSWHDWQRDPFACGAYSYVLAGGAGARRTLARPVQDTLYFAGEACDTGGEAATVGGALQSGARAAEQVMAGLQRRRRARRPSSNSRA